MFKNILKIIFGGLLITLLVSPIFTSSANSDSEVESCNDMAENPNTEFESIDCYTKIARSDNNVLVCENIKNPNYKSYCYHELATYSDSIEIISAACDRYDELNPGNNYKCLGTLSYFKKDISICELAKSEKEKVKCEREYKDQEFFDQRAEADKQVLLKIEKEQLAVATKFSHYSPEGRDLIAIYSIYFSILILLVLTLFYKRKEPYARRVIIFNVILMLLIMIGGSIRFNLPGNLVDAIDSMTFFPGGYIFSLREFLFSLPLWISYPFVNLYDLFIGLLLTVLLSIGYFLFKKERKNSYFPLILNIILFLYLNLPLMFDYFLAGLVTL